MTRDQKPEDCAQDTVFALRPAGSRPAQSEMRTNRNRRHESGPQISAGILVNIAGFNDCHTALADQEASPGSLADGSQAWLARPLGHALSANLRLYIREMRKRKDPPPRRSRRARPCLVSARITEHDLRAIYQYVTPWVRPSKCTDRVRGKGAHRTSFPAAPSVTSTLHRDV